jgi:hypothetical protein
MGEAVFTPDKKQVFYFDDFLGRNMLEALKLQHDSQIVGLIKRVYHDPTKRFVLTSRSTILNQGKHLTDLFALAKMDRNEYELRIEGLRRLDKARILYSHIWHSSLPEAMLDELFKNKRYKSVADHRNFNPRLISFITDDDLIGSIPPTKYWDHVVTTLDNPQSLWEHFFSQMSQDCRDMAYLVVFNGKSVSEVELKKAFRGIRQATSREPATVEYDSGVALRICTGSVLNRKVDGKTGAVTYDLYNPSIADYVLGSIKNWVVFAGFFESLETCAAIRTLYQMWNSKIILVEAYKLIVASLWKRASQTPPNDDYVVELSQLLLEHDDLSEKYAEQLRHHINNLDIASYSGSDKVLLNVFLNAIKKELVSAPDIRIHELCDRLDEWSLNIDDFDLLAEIVNLSSNEQRELVMDKARRSIKSYWVNSIDEFVTQSDLLRGIYDSEQFSEARSELRAAVADKMLDAGFDLERHEIDEICENLDLHEVVNRNIEWDRDSLREREPDRPISHIVSEDSLIDDLFERDAR